MILRLAVFLGLLQWVCAECPTPAKPGKFGIATADDEAQFNNATDCGTINGDFTIRTDVLSEVTVKGLKTVNGNISIESSPNLENFVFPHLVNVTGGIDLFKLDNWTGSFKDSFPNLKEVDYVSVQLLPALRRFDIEGIKTRGFLFSKTGVTDIVIRDRLNTDQGVVFELYNNTRLEKFTVVDYVGHKNATVVARDQATDYLMSFPYLETLGFLKIWERNSTTWRAPRLNSLGSLDIAYASDFPDFPAVKDMELLFVTDSQLGTMSILGLEKLKYLYIRNSTIASEKIDLPILKDMDVSGSLTSHDLSIGIPTRQNVFVDMETSVYINSSSVKTLSVPKLEHLHGRIEITNTPCFDCSALSSSLHSEKDITPDRFDCQSQCGNNIYLTSSNWTEVAGPARPQQKGPIIGGAVGGVAGLALAIALGVVLYKRRSASQGKRGEEPAVSGLEVNEMKQDPSELHSSTVKRIQYELPHDPARAPLVEAPGPENADSKKPVVHHELPA